MRAPTYALAIALAIAPIAGCAGAMTRTHGHSDGETEARGSEIQGTLVEARHYLEMGAVGDSHTLCAYLSALAEAPLGVLEEDGRLVLLTSRPSRIAALVTKSVRVTGTLSVDGRLLVPQSLHVKNGATWTPAEL